MRAATSLSVLPLAAWLVGGLPGQLTPWPPVETAAAKAWVQHILPTKQELTWDQIPWLTAFGDGMFAASAAGKPLVLYAMNGHPLGAT